MSLLTLEHVSRRHRQGSREHLVLHDVSFSVEEGELVAVLGPRHSGRSTLLRVAAGIEPPDSGAVHFAGRELAGGEALGGGIGFCRTLPRDGEDDTALDGLMVGQLARGVPASAARERAWSALERAGAARCAARQAHELDSHEAVRVAIARSLTLAPALLVTDEPTGGVDPLERDPILRLLRSLAEEGLAILMSTGDATALAGCDRALALSEGALRGETAPELAPVVPLRRAANA
jgi:ABC-type lipoprotein export system ATPase subunit